MKKLFGIFLVCFLVLAMPGVSKLQANVIDDETAYVDVGQQADAMFVVSADYAMVANWQAEVLTNVCSYTTAFICTYKPVGLETGVVYLPDILSNRYDILSIKQVTITSNTRCTATAPELYRVARDGIRQSFS